MVQGNSSPKYKYYQCNRNKNTGNSACSSNLVVRVINLSDIRQKDSEYLNPEIKKFHRIYSTPLHSMFIPEREEEFNEIISSINSSPIIMAWGTQGCLLDFAKECVERTEVYDRYGVRSVQDNYFLIHPQNRRASVFYMYFE